MRRATVVIGANYGDEGKGKLVDYITSQSTNVTVVRFNGGAQAGHTVVTPDAKRHVFHHVGSGTFAGARTYLAKHFVLNPVMFWHEYPDLLKLVGTTVSIAADPRCFVTTPYDMLINQLVEDHRGAARHGSVGVGFGETIERCQYPAFRLTKEDLDNADNLRQKILNIRDEWLPSRLQSLGVPRLARDDSRLKDDWITVYLSAVKSFTRAVSSAGLEYLNGQNIIFEGAQGLLLDMDSGEFPHVTRSNTGLTNVVPIARALALELEVIYVSRTYLTRHGAGPIKNEFTPENLPKDDTNVLHPYQGELRYGHLDPIGLAHRIKYDLEIDGRLVAESSLALTHLDQAALTLSNPPRPIRYQGTGVSRDDIEII